MNMHIYKKCFIYGISTLFFLNQLTCSIANAAILTQSSATYKEIMPIATEWKDAVINKRYDILVSYALPEAQEHAKIELNNPKSKLYKILYDKPWNNLRGGKSFYEILKNAKQLSIEVEQIGNLRDDGNGLRIYFFDAKKTTPQFPLNDMTLQKMIDKGDVVMMFFFKTEGRWYTSYSFDND